MFTISMVAMFSRVYSSVKLTKLQTLEYVQYDKYASMKLLNKIKTQWKE